MEHVLEYHAERIKLFYRRHSKNVEAALIGDNIIKYESLFLSLFNVIV